MVEATQYVYKAKELTILLIKQQDIHEGLWQLLVSFNFGAANMGAAEAEVLPTAVVQVGGIGIQKMNEKTPLTVDAAEVNPAA